MVASFSLPHSLWAAGDLPPPRHAPAIASCRQIGRVAPGLLCKTPDADGAFALALIDWRVRLNHDQAAGRAAGRGHQILHGLERLIDKGRIVRHLWADE